MKDTARIIMFLECNFKCRYCCNEKSQFSDQFVEMFLSEIDWSRYRTICVSGGEPFFRKEVLYKVLSKIPRNLPVYIYTNGILINFSDVLKLKDFHISGLNIGIHGVNQPKFIIPEVDLNFSVRWQAQNTSRKKLLSMYPDRITEKNTKFWKMDDCNRANEDWILLKDFQEDL